MANNANNADTGEDDADEEEDKEDSGGCRCAAYRQLGCPAPLLCLDDAVVLFFVVVINDDNSDDGVSPSTFPEAAVAVIKIFVVVIHILDGCQPRREGLMRQLPGSDGGSYYLHRWMGGASHGFVRPPPCLAASETVTMTASAGVPAGPLLSDYFYAAAILFSEDFVSALLHEGVMLVGTD